MSRNRFWRPQLTDQEVTRGWVFFGLYFLAFPVVMGLVQWYFTERLAFFLSALGYALLYYLFSTVLVLLLFWSFLKNGFFILMDWLPENLFAIGVGALGWLTLDILVAQIPFPVENLAYLGLAEQYAVSPRATILIAVILMPFVEEVLFRGLLFGALRRYSRPLAYAASIALFAVYHVYQFAVTGGGAVYLLLMLQYLPAGAALTWCYSTGGSVWSPMVLHAVIGAVTLWRVV